MGSVGGPEHSDDEDEGVTAEGRIVGDPFVAIERIRRQVVNDPEDHDGVATAYFSYYVHDRVRYPRYGGTACHRPGHYAWWDGFDPYYATCSVVDFRVNFGWFWGTPYWAGCVPYYVYVVRPYCPPYYRSWAGTCYSSWDGWGRWNTLWGSHLTRYKAPAPPPDYIAPSKYKWDRRWQNERPAPPGFLPAAGTGGRIEAKRVPVSGDPKSGVIARSDWRRGGELRRPVGRTPVGEAPRENGGPGRPVERSRWGVERAPLGGANGQGDGRSVNRREGRPGSEPPRNEPPVEGRRDNPPRGFDSPPRYEPPRNAPPRNERPSAPRNEQPGFGRAPRGEQPRFERPAPPRGEQPSRPRGEQPSRPRNERPAPSHHDDKQKGGGDRGDTNRRGGG